MWLQDNKVENLKLALKEINGVIIRPGETFSYWKMIGKPTYSKGYKDGMVLYYGKFKSGPGGGLCQLSNLIYWMTLHTPLTVVERHRHSFDVFPDSNRTQPFGSGATCVYNYRDLKIKNETDESYKIKLWMDEKNLNGIIMSNRKQYFQYTIYENSHAISHQHWGGYVRSNEIRRTIFDMEGDFLEDQVVCENHALMMYEPLLEG
jgi:vancomycin resistance protein VanW